MMQDEQFFQENQALPENWDFIASTSNGNTSEPIQSLATPDDGAYVQVCAALGLIGTLHLCKSTVACEFTLQDLKRSIHVLCSLPQNIAFDLSSGGHAIASDLQLNQLIQASPFAHEGRPIITVQIHAAARRKPCLMCLKTDCRHQASPLKRKSRQDTSSQRASLLEPTKAPKTESSAPTKRRKTHNSHRCALDLTSSNPALSLASLLVDSATF